MKEQPIIGVIGGGSCPDDVRQLAVDVGREIARRHGILICGGLSGVMEAACQGAKENAGLTIGVLPGFSAADANPYVDVPIVTGLADARNVIIVRTARALIAIDGAAGTLSEIAFALKFNKPVIGLQTWEIAPGVVRAIDPADAVEKAFSAIE